MNSSASPSGQDGHLPLRRPREEQAVIDTGSNNALSASPPPRQTMRTERGAMPSNSALVNAVSHQPDPPLSPAVSNEPWSSSNLFTGKPYSSRYWKLFQSRQKLPVYGSKRRIQQTVLDHPVTIIVGETGSGKTTQIPAFLAELGSSVFPQRIVCTQPRRIAALSVASRVAEELDVKLGEEVGYHVRFEPVLHPTRTRVLYMTDGLLLRECMSDPDLRNVSAVIVDEVHERTKSTDVSIGLLKSIVTRRPEFRVVVMSATLDIEKLTQFFPGAPVLRVSGRMYPVEVRYMAAPISEYVEAAVERVVDLHLHEPSGDVLCFLTGEGEIQRAVQATKARLASAGFIVVEDGTATSAAAPEEVCTTTTTTSNLHITIATPAASSTPPTRCVILPLYGALPLPEQQKVFAAYPADTRKIVFSTNIAETSVTVDGVVYVVDSCYQKQTLYNAGARVEYLLPAVISKASAEQRRGRAGRTRPGKCLRLVTPEDYAGFPEQTFPEILRSSILDTVLLLLEVGVSNPCQFDFIDPPSESSLNDAFFQLLLFGTVDEQLALTPLGKQMASFPVAVPAARMLLKAAAHGCPADMAVMVAMGEGGVILRGGAGRRPAGAGAGTAPSPSAASLLFSNPDGDHFTYFSIFHEVRRHQKSEQFCATHRIRLQAMHVVYNVYDQLRQLMNRHQIPFVSTYREHNGCGSVDSVALRKGLLEGLFLQVAYLLSPAQQLYRTVCDSVDARIHPESVLHQRLGHTLPMWVMYDRLEVQGEEGVFMRRVTAVEVQWLLEVSEFYRLGEDIADREIAFALQQAKMDLMARGLWSPTSH